MSLKEKHKKELRQIIEALEKCYFEELNEDNYWDDIVSIFKENYKNKFEFNHGATKAVLIFKEYNFVIKIPFQFDTSTGEPFYNASEGSCEEWDYCETEYNRYLRAKEKHLAPAFAEVDFLQMIDNYPIYIQEYAETEFSGDASDDEKNTIDQICDDNYFRTIHYKWEADFLHYYGKQAYNRFKQFVKDMGINDLRYDNIGYIGRRPVVVDYAGFYD